MYSRDTRVRVLFLLAILLVVIGSTHSITVSAQDDQTDPEALVETAAAEMLALQSFHFQISTPVGATMITEQVELEGVEGDVVRPDSFQATFSVELGFISLELDAIGIGEDIWVADPTAGEGEYVQVTGEGDQNLPPLELLNPDQLVLNAIELLRDPQISGTDEIDGVEVTTVEGTFDPGDLELLGTPVAGQFLEGLDPLAVVLSINEDNLIVRADFAGALLPSEAGAGRIVRRVDLSGFNEPVVIEAPEAGA